MARHGLRLPPRHGFTLISTGACSLAMLGALGLVIDLARLYVVRSEMQACAEAASLAAAAELDGTEAGLRRAATAAAGQITRWRLGPAALSAAHADFAAKPAGPWWSSPNPAGPYRFARVRVSGSVPLYLLSAVTSPSASRISAAAVAGPPREPAPRREPSAPDEEPAAQRAGSIRPTR